MATNRHTHHLSGRSERREVLRRHRGPAGCSSTAGTKPLRPGSGTTTVAHPGRTWSAHPARSSSIREIRAPGSSSSAQRTAGCSSTAWDEATQTWIWNDHGWPPGTNVATVTGALIIYPGDPSAGKFFVGTEDGRLFEHSWDEATQTWIWNDHRVAHPGRTSSAHPARSSSIREIREHRKFFRRHRGRPAVRAQLRRSHSDLDLERPRHTWRWRYHCAWGTDSKSWGPERRQILPRNLGRKAIWRTTRDEAT